MKRGYFLWVVIMMNISMFSPPVMALEDKKSFEAIADATVEASYPTSNYGGAFFLYVGRFND